MNLLCECIRLLRAVAPSLLGGIGLLSPVLIVSTYTSLCVTMFDVCTYVAANGYLNGKDGLFLSLSPTHNYLSVSNREAIARVGDTGWPALKLSNVGPGQYLDGRPTGNTGSC